MNDTEMMCERCTETPADTLIEHALYAEAVCNLCITSEVEWYSQEDINGEQV